MDSTNILLWNQKKKRGSTFSVSKDMQRRVMSNLPKRQCSELPEEACYCQMAGRNWGPTLRPLTLRVISGHTFRAAYKSCYIYHCISWGIATVVKYTRSNHGCTGKGFTLYMYEHYQMLTFRSQHLAALVSDRQVVSVIDDRWSVILAQTWTCTTWHRSCICSMSIGHTIPTRKEVVLPSSL